MSALCHEPIDFWLPPAVHTIRHKGRISPFVLVIARSHKHSPCSHRATSRTCVLLILAAHAALNELEPYCTLSMLGLGDMVADRLRWRGPNRHQPTVWIDSRRRSREPDTLVDAHKTAAVGHGQCRGSSDGAGHTSTRYIGRRCRTAHAGVGERRPG